MLSKCPHHPTPVPLINPGPPIEAVAQSAPIEAPVQSARIVIDLSLDENDEGEASEDDVVFLRECRTPSNTPLPSRPAPTAAEPKRFDLAAYLEASRSRILSKPGPAAAHAIIDLTVD